MVANRGDVWWVDFGAPHGSEPAYRRPAIVVQADAFNRSTIQTVIVVPMTASVGLAAAPGNVLCRRRDTSLPKASVANVSQLAVIDRSRLVSRVGSLPARLMAELDAGIRRVLGL